MNPQRRTRTELGRRVWQQLPLLIGLVVLWMLLWGELTALALASGVLVALLATRVFYLPAVDLSNRFNPLWFLVFLGRFGFQLFVASFQVAWMAVGPRSLDRNAVVAVDLVTRTDFMTTAVALAISLVPGSIVVDVDREESILYLHVLGIGHDRQVEAFRSGVLDTERLLVRALGSADDVRRVLG